jgi:hypothetical protein
MAQMGWVLLDYQDRPHRIGLYHGDQTGHVLIHCEMRIIKIDFSVLESKTYTFFIEDELCELRIHKEKKGFSYEFHVNKKTDTPLNRERRRVQRLDRRQGVLFVTLFVVALGLLAGGLIWFGREQGAKRIAEEGLNAGLSPSERSQILSRGLPGQAALSVGREAGGRRVYCLFTTAEGVAIRGGFPAPDTGRILLPNGFPLAERDSFKVQYLPDKPAVFFLNFNEPAPTTIERYLQQAIAAEQTAHPEESATHNRCVATTVFRLKGWPQLAHLIFQLEAPENNPNHNRNTYKRLVRDAAFAQELTKACWDQ